MPIQYHPHQRAICLCNFDAGFKEPEMTKRRPVIVVSSKALPRPGLVTIVPMSTLAPEPKRNFQCKIKLEQPLPHKHFTETEMWVKADMIYTVGFERLTRFHDGKENGKRKYLEPKINPQQFREIQRCMLNSLNLGFLTKHVSDGI